MDVKQLKQQYIELKWELFREEMLNDQFKRFKALHDKDELVDVLTHYFADSERQINELSLLLDQPCVVFDKVHSCLCGMKGGATSIGAEKVVNAMEGFHVCCNQKNADGCLMYLQQLKQEFYRLKLKLESLLQLEEKIIAAGGAV